MNGTFTSRSADACERPRDERRRQANHAGRPVLDSLLHSAGIAAVADPRTLDQPGDRTGSPEGLPLAELVEIPGGSARYYIASTIDDRGRVADRTPLKIMAWGPGTPARIDPIPHAGVIVVRRGGSDAVTGQGFLRLPVAVRQDCRITAGQRLLIVADPEAQQVLLYTPHAVDTMARTYHSDLTNAALRTSQDAK